MSDEFIITLEELARGVEPVSEVWRARALHRLDSLTKPRGSLGLLEALAAQYVAIRGERWGESMRKGVAIFAADHGVTAEGVSAYPAEVTRQMMLNFLRGGAAVSVLARLHGAELLVIDVGVAGAFEAAPGLLDRKISHGTRNMRVEAAMSEAQVQRALAVGAEVADLAFAGGQTVVAVGEMGIGNTTAASAMTCALTGLPAEAVTGRGTGILPQALDRKIAVVEASLRLHLAGASPVSAAEILRCVGGLEIAAMAGMMLRAAHHRLVVVVDGFISTAAAAVALQACPDLRGYLVAGHESEELGHQALLQYVRLKPLLSMGMRLGEGTGAVLAFPIIESAVVLYQGMATFESAGVSERSA